MVHLLCEFKNIYLAGRAPCSIDSLVPNGGSGGLVAVGGGNSGNSGGLTSGNAPAAKSGAKRFSSSDVRDDSNIIVQSIYNLVG